MAKIIIIANQKGGTGKTTTTVNLSAALAEQGKKVLLVDVDPQGNATSGLGINKSELDLSVYELLVNSEPAEKIIVQTDFKNLDVLPCNISLTGAEIELVGVMSRELRLKKGLAPVAHNYDYILIDSPPSLGLITLNALVASDSIIIPIQCEFYALEGVSQLMNTFNLVKENLNPNLVIEGVLMTMADFRTNLTSEVIGEIRNYFEDSVYTTVIPRNIRLSEAPSHGKPITSYDSISIGAQRYRELAQELISANEQKVNDSNSLEEISQSFVEEVEEDLSKGRDISQEDTTNSENVSETLEVVSNDDILLENNENSKETNVQ